ncbi:MAG: BMP family ABC transporter substrate-binding protein [Actinomycetota bacterium]
MLARAVCVPLAVLLVGSACSASDSERSRPVTVGFIFVGARDDLGYNQAAWEGSEALARAFPDLRVIRVEHVPEDERAVAVLEDLIDEGASILFATSFGHRDAAYEVAQHHPDVTVLHEGGLELEPDLPNFGTYFGTHSEALFLAGMAAGAATRTGKLGFVVAFPIPATFNNVNAFTLGAQALAPEVTTEVVFTGDWCNPAEQSAAAAHLISAGVDVIAQHQDCTRTILESAESAGIYSVGYHADGSEVAPEGWLIGAVWVWDEVLIDVVGTILDGRFEGSVYEGDFRGSMAGGDNPFVLTEPGPAVTPETRAHLEEERKALESGASPFSGPLVDRDGTVRVPAGTALDSRGVESMDWFVAGVIGDIPG